MTSTTTTLTGKYGTFERVTASRLAVDDLVLIRPVVADITADADLVDAEKARYAAAGPGAVWNADGIALAPGTYSVVSVERKHYQAHRKAVAYYEVVLRSAAGDTHRVTYSAPNRINRRVEADELAGKRAWFVGYRNALAGLDRFPERVTAELVGMYLEGYEAGLNDH